MENTVRKYKVKAFGIVKEIMGGKEQVVESAGQTVGDLKRELMDSYPQLMELRSFFIAVNNAYATDDIELQETDEIALIPPVSGG